MFDNLISNNNKYSDGDFSVSASENGNIVFSYSAFPLTSVTAGRLLDRFYTVETGIKSTGLGLSLHSFSPSAWAKDFRRIHKRKAYTNSRFSQ